MGKEYVLLLGYIAGFLVSVGMIIISAKRVVKLYKTTDKKLKIGILPIVICFFLSLSLSVIMESKNHIVDIIRGFCIFLALYLLSKGPIEFFIGEFSAGEKEKKRKIIPTVYILFLLFPVFVLSVLFFFIFTR